MNSKQSGLIKIIAGLLLGAVGVLGFVFGKNAKTASLRIAILVLSGISLFSGFYLLFDGVSDVAIGRVGDYKLGQPKIQAMVYDSKSAFKAGLVEAIKHQKDLRRLKFECPDKSKSFTVYTTSLGSFGVPNSDVTCADGFQLLKYRS